MNYSKREKRKNRRKKGFRVIGLILLVLLLSGFYGTQKSLPEGISVSSPWIKAETVEFFI